MPASQGKYPRIKIPGKMVGFDENLQATNNSFEYRGRPYSLMNMIDRASMDYQREVAKQVWQRGFRTVGIYLTTGTIIPKN